MIRSSARDPRSGCPIATTLDIVGDRWTLIVVRDMLNGKMRFSQFLASPEQIAASVLTDRLERLEAEGLIEARAYQDKPTRYEYRLTGMGEAMLPILQEVCRWANRFMPETSPAPESFMGRKVTPTVHGRMARKRGNAAGGQAGCRDDMGSRRRAGGWRGSRGAE